MTTAKKTYPREKCEICGVEVSTFPPVWAKHQQSHLKDERKNEDVDKVKAKIKDPAARKAYEEALAAQERFITTPQAFVGTNVSDERFELRKLYVPESLGPNPTKHVYFGERTARDVDASKGYASVFNEHGEHVHHGGDWMYWCPISMYEMREEQKGNESRTMLHGMQTELKDDDATAKGVKEDALTVKEGKIKEI